jgi:hypothetical protein
VRDSETNATLPEETRIHRAAARRKVEEFGCELFFEEVVISHIAQPAA